MLDWVDVCAVEALPEGGYAVVELDDGTAVAVFCTGGEYLAIEDVCTHDGAPLAETGRVEGGQVICGRHGARFCLKTGRVLKPPAYEDVATFPVRVVDGKVQIRDARFD